jgi:hypothetical protein
MDHPKESAFLFIYESLVLTRRSRQEVTAAQPPVLAVA